MQKFSFNFHAQSLEDRSKALAWVEANKPETAVILNDSSFASACVDLGVKYPILRITNNDDEIQLKLRSFKEWWTLVKPSYADKRLIVHFANEPHSALDKLNDFMVEGMQTLAQEGLRGVFGNFSVGTPNDWKQLQPALNLMSKYPDMFFLGLHEYMMYSPDLCIPYEIGRYKQIPQRVSIILTEFGFDYIDDVWQHNQHTKVRGWKDHVQYLQRLSVTNPEQTLLSMMKTVFDELYNKDSNVLGVNFFCYGNSGGWDNYNAEHWQYLKDNVGVFQMANQIVTNTQPVTVNISPIGTTPINRREQPNTTSPIHGTLTQLTQVTKIALTNDGWSQYVFNDGTWWIKDNVVQIQVPTTISINLYNAPPEDVQKVKDLLSQLKDLFTKYGAEFV